MLSLLRTLLFSLPHLTDSYRSLPIRTRIPIPLSPIPLFVAIVVRLVGIQSRSPFRSPFLLNQLRLANLCPVRPTTIPQPRLGVFPTRLVPLKPNCSFSTHCNHPTLSCSTDLFFSLCLLSLPVLYHILRNCQDLF